MYIKTPVKVAFQLSDDLGVYATFEDEQCLDALLGTIKHIVIATGGKEALVELLQKGTVDLICENQGTIKVTIPDIEEWPRLRREPSNWMQYEGSKTEYFRAHVLGEYTH